jgi:hypothetical protein
MQKHRKSSRNPKVEEAKGFCSIYELRPPDCRVYECGLSLKTNGEICRGGCVKCCLGRSVARDEDREVYHVETGLGGPCKFLTYTKKPKWVRELEALRDEMQQKTDQRGQSPLETAIDDEERKRTLHALQQLDKADREFISDIFGMEGGKPLELREACEKRGIPLKQGEIKYKHLLEKLRRQLED